MTLVQFFVNFLRPYADMPEFVTCVIKALEKLGHPIFGKSMYVEESGAISKEAYCHLANKEAHAVIVDELCDD